MKPKKKETLNKSECLIPEGVTNAFLFGNDEIFQLTREKGNQGIITLLIDKAYANQNVIFIT